MYCLGSKCVYVLFGLYLPWFLIHTLTWPNIFAIICHIVKLLKLFIWLHLPLLLFSNLYVYLLVQYKLVCVLMLGLTLSLMCVIYMLSLLLVLIVNNFVFCWLGFLVMCVYYSDNYIWFWMCWYFSILWPNQIALYIYYLVCSMLCLRLLHCQ